MPGSVTRHYPLSAAEEAEFASFLAPGEEIPDAPYWFLAKHYLLQRETQALQYQLQCHRRLLKALHRHLASEQPALDAQRLAREIERFLATPELRRRCWDVVDDIHAYLLAALKDYVQDCESIASVAVHDELPEVKALIPDLEMMLHGRHPDDVPADQAEEWRMAVWTRLGTVLPYLWD
jgi:hypothetical protein